MNAESAINIIETIRSYLTAGNPMWNVEVVNEACDKAIEALKQTEWVPVSEGLPEKDDRYLITTFGILKREYVEMACFSTASKTWEQYDLEYGYVPVDDVIAWMPLPEPPKMEGE